jgi:hypothetical protein
MQSIVDSQPSQAAKREIIKQLLNIHPDYYPTLP